MIPRDADIVRIEINVTRVRKKVEGKFALFCLEYNLERKKLLGFEKIMELMDTVYAQKCHYFHA